MGEIDKWGSKYEILFLPAIGILLYTFITAVSFFPQIWNVPVKITDENKEAVYFSAKDLFILIKVEILAFFFYINYHTLTAQPLPITFLPVFIIIFFGTIIFFTKRIIRLGKRIKA
jgi:hypothetical protein